MSRTDLCEPGGVVPSGDTTADTVAGATASGRAFSLIETARANGHNPQQYLSVLLTELPNVNTLEQVEALLPWNLTTSVVAQRYASYPSP